MDEVHELPKVYQTALYLALDKRQIVVNGGNSFQIHPPCRVHASSRHDRRVLPAPTAEGQDEAGAPFRVLHRRRN